MKGHRTKFSRKMEAAVGALLTQRKHEEAARAIGIGTTTLLRWQKEPEFQKAYREARRPVHQQSVARLQQATGAAVTTLLKVLVDPATPASVKVRAADSMLDQSAKAIELEDIEAHGKSYEEPWRDPKLYENGRLPTWAEVLRSHQAHRCAEAEARRAEGAGTAAMKLLSSTTGETCDACDAQIPARPD